MPAREGVAGAARRNVANVLGIHYGHNATVCLLRDGRIEFCQSEERLNRLKNSAGFPSLTLEHVYERWCPPEEVDGAFLFQKSVWGYLALEATGFRPFRHGQYLEPRHETPGLRARWFGPEWAWRRRQRRSARREKDEALRAKAHAHFSRELRLPPEKVHYVDHHASHAYSALPGLVGWERALVFTLDGVGDDACASVSVLEGGHLREVDRTNHRNSLGYYYAATTGILGMRAGEHEFKVMGLAPYAREPHYRPILERLRGLLRVTEDGRWESAVTPAALRGTLEEVYRYRRFDHVAGAIQALSEELVTKWVGHWVAKLGCRDVAVAGGVFMNVKACQRLAEQPWVERLFVVPSAADETTAVGCAVWGARQVDPAVRIAPLRDLYLGRDYDEAEVETAIRGSGAASRYGIRRPDDLADSVAELLARGEIVARCAGRMEFGARALGNRSILANPSDSRVVQVINRAIKSRDYWMPFTPSILAEEMDRYVVNPKRIPAPYMCMTFDSTEEARRDLAGAMHPEDHTLRPQAVERAWNPEYHAILSRFRDRTGIGGVLNTSFNLHGEPNVGSPEDAIRTVDSSGLRHVVLGPFLLSKRSADPSPPPSSKKA